MTITTGTLARPHLSAVLEPYSASHLGFALATRTQATTRSRMARLTVMSRTWDRLRGQG